MQLSRPIATLAAAHAALLLLACSSVKPAADLGRADAASRDGGVADGLPDLGNGGEQGRVIPGDKQRLLLRGVVVSPDEVLAPGEVLTQAERILCVARSCAGQPGADGATIIDTAGVIYPGLIAAHGHTQYHYLPVWKNPKLYDHHGQWQAAADYKAFLALHNQLEKTLTCEMLKYGEIRALTAGTTTIQGTLLRKCVQTLVRNIDLSQGYNGLTSAVRTNVLGIDTVSTDDATKLKAEFASGKTNAYIIHLGEGKPGNAVARGEFDSLEQLGLLAPQVIIIHGTALGTAELDKLKSAGMGLVWSPSSNLALYGETNDIAALMARQIPVALSPDWTPSGEPNVLAELRFARKRYTSFSAQQLVAMVTSTAADVLRIGDKIGRLKEGYQADVLVLGGVDRARPYDALVNATLPQVRLVLIGGRALYGAPHMVDPLAPNAYCEALTVCGAKKSICVKETDVTTDTLQQTLADIEGALKAGYTPGILDLNTTCE